MRAVAQRIKQEREKQGKSTIEMAHILGVLEQEIIRIENGELQLTMRDIDDFAFALDVDKDYLKFGDRWSPNASISQSNIDNPTFDSSNIATNTATNITNNNYYTDNNMQSQIDRIEKAAHAGRLGAISQMDRIEEQNKLLLERMEHLNEKIDFLLIAGEITPKDIK
ncbi:MAG: helix-turn-helix transcriptional regulator [Haemophilus pittmaniae]|uniref:helix-turn-helix domain-containing protein n=1 Tax=Haemophilus pittmaniae TaxID=249188 RepID=UPI0023F3131B|nr:helix-turn-helix transcriptional regulator [Haemophilus pittmaniae]MBS6026332.1 helix-turn-helix transcriptional regulator [Haemophilus pittmaniae]